MRNAPTRAVAAAALALAVLGGAPAHAADPPTGRLLDLGTRSLDSLDGSASALPWDTPPLSGQSRFSADGSALITAAWDDRAQAEQVVVKQSEGPTYLLASFGANVEMVGFAPDGDAWAVTRGYSAVRPKVWRLHRGSDPVLVADLPGTAEQFVSDPRQPLILFLRTSQVWSLDPATGVTGAFADAGVDSVEGVNPVDGSALVNYFDDTLDDAFGVVAQGAAQPTPIMANVDMVGHGYVSWSPDGQHVALRHPGSTPTTSVHALDGSLVASVPGVHTAWQPCPTTCLDYAESGPQPTVPSRPRIRSAFSGAPGGTVTAGFRWRPPADLGGSPVGLYVIEAAVLNDRGHVVNTLDYHRGPQARSAAFRLADHRYRFRIRAVNATGYGTWSGWTDAVRAR